QRLRRRTGRRRGPAALDFADEAPARHRQQELLLLVDAALGAAAPGADPVRGSAAQVRGQRRRAERRRHRALLEGAQGTGADDRRRAGVGLARDLRDRGRNVPRQASVARGAAGAPLRPLGVRRDALGLPEPARQDADEHPQPVPGQGPDTRVAEGHRPHGGAVDRMPRTFRRRGQPAVRQVQRRRRFLRAGGDALPGLRRQGAGGSAGVLRGGEGPRRGARMVRRRPARNRVRRGRRTLRKEVKVYTVGGAVRDELLGLPVKERDYVVVGATPEEMVRQGFKPVGKDFPVFLHPKTHEEYALARTERKSGRGYKGFTVYASPEVTLEEDLRRRDLTINAVAKAEDGTIVDPFGGRKDLSSRILKHVSEAFAEDPVRILRAARFAARFGFSVHPETMALMRRMVESGETDHLVAERVWQEFAKGLAEAHAEKMFEVLEACGLLRRNLPEITRYPRGFAGSVPARFALLTWPLDESRIETLSERLHAPNEVRELALTAARSREKLRGTTPGAL